MSGEPQNEAPKARDRAAVRFPPPLVFLIAVGIGAVVDRFLPAFPLPDVAGLTRVAGMLCVGAGCGVLAGALLLFFRTGQNPEPWTPTPTLVLRGVYRFTRNPMYLGMALVHGGVALWLLDGWLLVTLPLAMAVVHRIAIQPEEIYLEQKFGEAYASYRRRVRRWL